jgi:hypothetical protein
MNAMPSGAKSGFYKGLLPVELAGETPVFCPADLKDDLLASRRPDKRASYPVARFLITFYIGVTATLAWQSYGAEARQTIANLSPYLDWLAPQARVAQPVPDTIEQITRSINRVAGASQAQIMRSVDQLAAGQEQLAREILKLQAMSQYGVYKNSEPPLRPAPASARTASQRPPQAH